MVAFCAVVVLQTTPAVADEHDDANDDASVAAMLETIQQLQAQIAELQAQLAAQRGEMRELREEIRTQLREGMSGEEVQKLQELLATDPDIYPEQLTTGYFGNLTRQALSRLQSRHGLHQSGELDKETRELINQYFAERTGRDDAPEGLLRAPGIRQAVERGVCERARGNVPFCPQDDASVPETDDDEVNEEEEDDDEENGDEEGVEELSADRALRALEGAGTATDYVQQAINAAPRSVNVREARQLLFRALSEYRSARRAYNAERYRDAYEGARTAREYAADAFAALPERAEEREAVREAIELFRELLRDQDRDEDAVSRTCRPDEFTHLIGEAVDRDAIMDIWEDVHGGTPGNNDVRIHGEGDPITMDHRPSRLNVVYDADEVVTRVSCG